MLYVVCLSPFRISMSSDFPHYSFRMPNIGFQNLPLNIYIVVFGTAIFVFILSLLFCCYLIRQDPCILQVWIWLCLEFLSYLFLLRCVGLCHTGVSSAREYHQFTRCNTTGSTAQVVIMHSHFPECKNRKYKCIYLLQDIFRFTATKKSAVQIILPQI